VARDLVDVGTEFGARVTRRLREDGIAWLITVSADGTPQPNPVWFIWNGESALIYSVPRQAKVKNIERNPKVALHLDSQSASVSPRPPTWPGNMGCRSGSRQSATAASSS